MRLLRSALLSSFLLLSVSASAFAQAATDVYHVHFVKAALGQAANLGESLQVPDPKAAMPTHQIVLRHQHGDDWDYAVIQHLGPKPTIDVTTYAAPPAGVTALREWHEDAFVGGPAWPEFAKQMGVAAEGGVYTVSMWRPAAGHREQLAKALSAAPGSKASGNVVLAHLEGGPWTFLGLSRYNSWADFAADQTGAAPAGANPWSEIRSHGAFHRDTIADRLPLK